MFRVRRAAIFESYGNLFGFFGFIKIFAKGPFTYLKQLAMFEPLAECFEHSV